MEQGEVVAKLLETPLKNEIAVFGIVWIQAAPEFYLEKYQDIETFEKGKGVSAIKKISDPPRREDFDEFTLPEKDLEDLRTCKVRDCEIKVGEEGLKRIHGEVNWSAPDAHSQATAVIRKMALERLQAYQSGGNKELSVYVDKKKPNYVAREFAGLLENSPYLPAYIPEFHRYLLDYPKAELPRSKEFFYWTANVFGLKPIVRLNHVVIYRNERDNVVIGSKQLYASHYFHAAYELRALIQDSAQPDRKGFYLASLNRSRSDGLTGLVGSLIRGKVRKSTLKGTESYLASSKTKFEEEYRKSQ